MPEAFLPYVVSVNKIGRQERYEYFTSNKNHRDDSYRQIAYLEQAKVVLRGNHKNFRKQDL